MYQEELKGEPWEDRASKARDEVMAKKPWEEGEDDPGAVKDESWKITAEEARDQLKAEKPWENDGDMKEAA